MYFYAHGGNHTSKSKSKAKVLSLLVSRNQPDTGRCVDQKAEVVVVRTAVCREASNGTQTSRMVNE